MIGLGGCAILFAVCWLAPQSLSLVGLNLASTALLLLVALWEHNSIGREGLELE